MNEKKVFSGKRLPSERWVNLLLVVLITFFLLYLGMPLFRGESTVAIDYVAFYAAGEIINEGEFANIYDLERLESKEREILYLNGGAIGPNFDVMAILYLPVFIIPFSTLARMEFWISVIVWLVGSAMILIGYLWFFIKKISVHVTSLQMFLILLVSYPTLLNFHYGQVNVWLVICFGEFIRATISKKPLLAGLWLGGLLIKPQLLILLLLFLLLQRKYKALLGLSLSVISLTGLSYILIGAGGLSNLIEAVRLAASGGVSSSPMYMMNWRMLSYYLSFFTSETVGWIFLGVASLVTAAVPLIVFRKTKEVDSPEFWVGLLSVFAATTLVAYHAHLHTAMIMIPILLFLFAKGWMDQRSLILWVAIPYLGNVFLYSVALLILGNILPLGFGYIIEVGFGSGVLIANLILLVWSLLHPSGVKKAPTLVQDA